MSAASRGDVRTLRDGRKVVVLSADAVNATAWPWCAPVVRRVHVPPELAVFAVTTHETDPITGVVLVLESAPVPDDVLGDNAGTLVGATLARVDVGIRALFDLP